MHNATIMPLAMTSYACPRLSACILLTATDHRRRRHSGPRCSHTLEPIPTQPVYPGCRSRTRWTEREQNIHPWSQRLDLWISLRLELCDDASSSSQQPNYHSHPWQGPWRLFCLKPSHLESSQPAGIRCLGGAGQSGVELGFHLSGYARS